MGGGCRDTADRSECEKKMRNRWNIREKPDKTFTKKTSESMRQRLREADLEPREKGRRRKCGAEGDEKRAQWRE